MAAGVAEPTRGRLSHRSTGPWYNAGVTERRRFERIPSSAEISIQQVSAGDLRRGRGRNISGSGILFTSRTWLEEGALLRIEVRPPATRDPAAGIEPMRALVRVVRVEGAQAPWEVAAEFITLDLP